MIIHIIQLIACAAFTIQTTKQIIIINNLRANIKTKQDEASFLAEERQKERRGRIKAEKELREHHINQSQQQQQQQQQNDDALDNNNNNNAIQKYLTFPFRPIGNLKTCFDQRNGTPRQPLLVPSARGSLCLRPELSPDSWDGLQKYSHCWVLYVFHENTDLQRLFKPDSFQGIRSKIRVPRLNGKKLGAFATRSPHRPCPIGLSIAKVLNIQGRTLTLGGIDIVNNTPILDIKPYVPFSDALPAASTPLWVVPQAEDEPLQISTVNIDAPVDQKMELCWERKRKTSMYASYLEFRELVVQVLSMDIRSVTQRVKVVARKEDSGIDVPSLGVADKGSEGDKDENGKEEDGKWHVFLDGIDISYHIDESTHAVSIRNASVHSTLLLSETTIDDDDIENIDHYTS